MRMPRGHAKISAVQPRRAHPHQYLFRPRHWPRRLLNLHALRGDDRCLHGFGHATIPCACQALNADDAIGHTGGPSARTHRTMQIDVFGNSSISARNVEEAIRTLMNYKTNVVSGGPSIMSAKVSETSAADFGDGLAEGLHRLILTYSINHTI
jgi:hypothetical protein